MKKILKNPETYVPELLEGLLAAHPQRLKAARAMPTILSELIPPVKGKVDIVTVPLRFMWEKPMRMLKRGHVYMVGTISLQNMLTNRV